MFDFFHYKAQEKMFLICGSSTQSLPLSVALCVHTRTRTYTHTCVLTQGLSIYPHPQYFSPWSYKYKRSKTSKNLRHNKI